MRVSRWVLTSDVEEIGGGADGFLGKGELLVEGDVEAPDSEGVGGVGIEDLKRDLEAVGGGNSGGGEDEVGAE